MKKAIYSESMTLPGFQIAPLIDVVFVIMLFFMVMAASQRKEGEMGLRLPSGQLTSLASPLPDAEIWIGVHADGSVSMNEQPVDQVGTSPLPELVRSLRRLVNSTEKTHSRVLATIQAEPEAGFQRVMDVLDALKRADIEHVTFEVEGSDAVL